MNRKIKTVSRQVVKWFGFIFFSIALGAGLVYLMILHFNFDLIHRKGTTSSKVVKQKKLENFHKLPLIQKRKVKNVILFIGDGMGLNQITATRYKYYGANGRLNMERMPVTGILNTFAANGALVTDSGAGATALATGYKTDIGMIGVTPDGKSKTSILEFLQVKGLSTGLVTTSDITDATPGAFASHVASRKMKLEIVKQLIESKVNLLISGGETFHGQELEGKERISVIKHAQNNGYHVVNEKEAFFNADGPLLLALFAGMASDKLGDIIAFNKEAPTLKECTKKAVDLLDKDDDGFFLVVEEEGIDSGSHINRIDFVTSHLKNFDDAVAVGVEYAIKDEETLVLVLADHETGGLTLVQDNSIADEIGVRWSTDGHTGQPVPLFAFGPQAEAFTGVWDNTQLPKIIARVMGVDSFLELSESP